MSFCDKSHLEDGDKILLPPSALETLARLHIDYPMLFNLENEAVARHTHCGVLEFSAPEGNCYMPYWMMQNLFLKEGSILRVQNATLPKATFVKIRPQSSEFLNISNPRAVLEGSLRKFSCMTVGDTICIQYNDKQYFLDVREVRPAEAACIIETDCEVDFEAPADYVEPSRPQTDATAAASSSLPYGGVPTVAAGQAQIKGPGQNGLRLNRSSDSDAQTLRDMRMKRFEAFHGTGRSMASGAVAEPHHRPVSTQATPPAAPAAAADKPAKQPSKPFEGAGRRLR